MLCWTAARRLPGSTGRRLEPALRDYPEHPAYGGSNNPWLVVCMIARLRLVSYLDVFHLLGLVALIVCPVTLFSAGKRDQRRLPAEGVSYEH